MKVSKSNASLLAFDSMPLVVKRAAILMYRPSNQ
jgi:hypothetical protein